MDLIIWIINNLGYVEKEFRNYIKRRAAPMRDRVNGVLISGHIFTTDTTSYEHRNPHYKPKIVWRESIYQ